MLAALASNSPATREEWLLIFAEAMRPHIKTLAGLDLPLFRVTCGFPSIKGLITAKGYRAGECWPASLSDDNHAEIFISPVIDDVRDVARILSHELLHAALPQAGHNRTFQKAARDIGLTKPYTSTPTTPQFWEWCEDELGQMPPYPHAKLQAHKSRPIAAPKKQTNRQMKCECKSCGYVARTTRKWIDLLGPPLCPVLGHGPMQYNP